VSPMSRRKASESSCVVTVRSEKGTPRLLSMARALSQGLQGSVVYSVTGNLEATWRSSKGSRLLPLETTLASSPISETLPCCADTGALSENVTFPSGPTMRYTVCADGAEAKLSRAAESRQEARGFFLLGLPVHVVKPTYLGDATKRQAWVRVL
jgi:hypothetical protein